MNTMYPGRENYTMSAGPFTISKRAIVNGLIGGLILWTLIGAAFAAILWRWAA